MKLRILAGALCLLLTVGCAAAQADPAPEVEPVPEEPANLFETMPDAFLLASGAGAWGVELTVEPDGSFAGMYQDSEMGETGEGYPHGTCYCSAFSGKFTRPEQVDETTWSMEIETLELETPTDKTEEIIDEIRYVYTGPYGLENAGELLIYLPATPVEGLAEDVLWAVRGPYDWQPAEDGTLGVYVIYNPAEELGFAQYPL